MQNPDLEKLRSVQRLVEVECQIPNQFISFLSGCNVFNLHEKYSSSSMQEKQLLARYESYLYQMFPKSSSDLSNVRMICLHGTCKVVGSYFSHFYAMDMGDMAQDLPVNNSTLLELQNLPLLDVPYRLAKEDLNEFDWTQAKVTVEQYHLNPTSVQLFWKKPLTQMSLEEQKTAHLLQEEIKKWDFKLDNREVQSMLSCLKTHYHYHLPAIQSFEQRGQIPGNQRFLNARMNQTFLFSYLIFLGEAPRERYQFLMKNTLARINDHKQIRNGSLLYPKKQKTFQHVRPKNHQNTKTYKNTNHSER